MTSVLEQQKKLNKLKQPRQSETSLTFVSICFKLCLWLAAGYVGFLLLTALATVRHYAYFGLGADAGTLLKGLRVMNNDLWSWLKILLMPEHHQLLPIASPLGGYYCAFLVFLVFKGVYYLKQSALDRDQISPLLLSFGLTPLVYVLVIITISSGDYHDYFFKGIMSNLSAMSPEEMFNVLTRSGLYSASGLLFQAVAVYFKKDFFTQAVVVIFAAFMVAPVFDSIEHIIESNLPIRGW